MANIQFGTKAALKAATPEWVKWIYRGAGLASAIWVIVSGTYTEIPEHIQLQIMKGIGLANSLIYLMCQFAGYAKSETVGGDA